MIVATFLLQVFKGFPISRPKIIKFYSWKWEYKKLRKGKKFIYKISLWALFPLWNSNLLHGVATQKCHGSFDKMQIKTAGKLDHLFLPCSLFAEPRNAKVLWVRLMWFGVGGMAKKLIDFLPLIWLNWCALHICSMVWFHMVLTLILYSVEQSDCYITHWPIQNRNYCIVCMRVNEQTEWHKQETLHSIDRQNELPQIN